MQKTLKVLIWIAAILAVIAVILSIWSVVQSKKINNQEAQVEQIVNQVLSTDLANKPADENPVNPLIGTTWQIVSLTNSQDVLDLSSYENSIQFSDQEISGRICNSFSGNYKIVDDVHIVADGPITRTEMACDNDLMDVENAFLSGLEKGWGYSFGENDVLALVNTEGWVIGLMKK